MKNKIPSPAPLHCIQIITIPPNNVPPAHKKNFIHQIIKKRVAQFVLFIFHWTFTQKLKNHHILFMCQQIHLFHPEIKKKINKNSRQNMFFAIPMPGPQQNIFESKQIIHYIKKNSPLIFWIITIIRCLYYIYTY